MTREYKIGDVIEGVVSGIQNYGVFVKLDDQTQGLVHISECHHGYIEDLSSFVKIGQQVRVIIIDIDEYSHKISLSMRALEKKNVPTYPARNKKIPRRHTPKIGFKTLKQQMPSIIEEALKNIQNKNIQNK